MNSKQEVDNLRKEIYFLLAFFFFGTLFLLVSSLSYVLHLTYPNSVTYLSIFAFSIFLFLLFYYIVFLTISGHYVLRTYNAFIANKKKYYRNGFIVFSIAVLIGVGYFSGWKGIVLLASSVVVGLIVQVLAPHVKKLFKSKGK